MSYQAGASAKSATGFWEPHSSSIDFCESNYLHNDMIIEPHNVWSSIVGIAAFGFLGLGLSLLSETKQSSSPLSEWRVQLGCLSLALIGVGSALLHGTLHWFFQSSDELPMIYIVLCLLYAIAEVDAPPGRPKYPWLAPFLMGVGVVDTIIYYIFQQFYAIFILTFVFGTTVCIFWSIKLVYYTPQGMKKPTPTIRRLFYTGTFSLVAIGTPTWIFDMLLCHHYIDVVDQWHFPLKGITPHVIWHISSGLSAFCGVLSWACYRCECLGVAYRVEYLLGVIPLVFLDSDKKQASVTNNKAGAAAKRPKAVKEQ